MTKLVKLFDIFFSTVLLLTACKYDRGIILFHTQPINRENALTDEKVFTVGQRVYYLFIAPKKMDNKYIRVQIFKMIENAPWGGNELVRRKDFRLMKNEHYYHTDYFTLYEKGRYIVQVFSMDDFVRPLSLGDFYIK
jgi:hypothetical protein